MMNSPAVPGFLLNVVRVEYDHATCRAHFAGEVDQSTADFFADTLIEVIEDPRWRRIEVHLRDVSFMDSSGIDALVWCRNRAVARGRELVVESPHDNVLRVLMITGVRDMLCP